MSRISVGTSIAIWATWVTRPTVGLTQSDCIQSRPWITCPQAQAIIHHWWHMRTPRATPLRCKWRPIGLWAQIPNEDQIGNASNRHLDDLEEIVENVESIREIQEMTPGNPPVSEYQSNGALEGAIGHPAAFATEVCSEYFFVAGAHRVCRRHVQQVQDRQ